MNLTCPKSDYLQISDDILDLAKDLLTPDEIQYAEEISIKLSNKATRSEAKKILKEMVGLRPKRPIYYTYYEIGRLPRWTRYAIENLGHFVDLMIKEFATEKLANSKHQTMSLGPNLKNIKTKIPIELYSSLVKFNSAIYVPSKHDFKVDETIRNHRFTTKEVVFTIFITLKLKEKLVEMSDAVKDYCENK